MYSTAERMSASEALVPPLGGMAPLPLMALATSAGMPCAMRGAHAALSPNFGAPAAPVPWQAKQADLYSASPAPPAAAVAAGAAAATVVAGAAAAAGAAVAAGAETATICGAEAAAVVAAAAGRWGSANWA